MAQLSLAQFGFWVKLLCLANQQDPRGEIYYGEKKFSTLSVKILNISRKSSEKFLTKFENLGLIHFDEENKCLVITNWHKRQFPSDDVTARTIKHMRNKRLRERSSERPRVEESIKNNKSTEKTTAPFPASPQNDDHIETWQKINALSKELKPSFPQVKDFIGKANKMNKHPGAILQALEKCFKYKPRDPKAYFWQIVKIEDGNKNYEDFRRRENDTWGKEALRETGVSNGQQGRGNLDQR